MLSRRKAFIIIGLRSSIPFSPQPFLPLPFILLTLSLFQFNDTVPYRRLLVSSSSFLGLGLALLRCKTVSEWSLSTAGFIAPPRTPLCLCCLQGGATNRTSHNWVWHLI